MKPTASLLFLFFIEVSHAFGMLSANALSLTVAGCALAQADLLFLPFMRASTAFVSADV